MLVCCHLGGLHLPTMACQCTPAAPCHAPCVSHPNPTWPRRQPSQHPLSQAPVQPPTGHRLGATRCQGKPPGWQGLCSRGLGPRGGHTTGALAPNTPGLAHTGPRPVGRFCATQLCCFGQPFRQQRAASWGPKKFQAFGATWVAYTCPPWLASAPPLPLAMPLASATQTPPGPGGSPASTRCRRHRCSRPQATAWAQRGAKVSHLGGRGCAPEVWAPAVATQRVHWHPTPQAWQNGRFAGAPWCPNGAVSCATSPRRPQKFHGPRHKPPGWQRKPQEGPRPRRGRPCGGTGPPPSSAVLAQGPTHHAAPNGIGPPWCCT